MNEEIWVDCSGFESHYEVSNMGRVRSKERVVEYVRLGKIQKHKVNSKILSPEVTKNGYLRVVLCVNSTKTKVSLHRMVAKSFLGESCLDVNHIDGDKSNNRIENLEWSTKSQNMKHSIHELNNKHGFHYDEEFRETVLAHYKVSGSCAKTGEKFGVSQQTVMNWFRRACKA